MCHEVSMLHLYIDNRVGGGIGNKHIDFRFVISVLCSVQHYIVTNEEATLCT
jgi:hypothetical protein